MESGTQAVRDTVLRKVLEITKCDGSIGTNPQAKREEIAKFCTSLLYLSYLHIKDFVAKIKDEESNIFHQSPKRFWEALDATGMDTNAITQVLLACSDKILKYRDESSEPTTEVTPRTTGVTSKVGHEMGGTRAGAGAEAEAEARARIKAAAEAEAMAGAKARAEAKPKAKAKAKAKAKGRIETAPWMDETGAWPGAGAGAGAGTHWNLPSGGAMPSIGQTWPQHMYVESGVPHGDDRVKWVLPPQKEVQRAGLRFAVGRHDTSSRTAPVVSQLQGVATYALRTGVADPPPSSAEHLTGTQKLVVEVPTVGPVVGFSVFYSNNGMLFLQEGNVRTIEAEDVRKYVRRSIQQAQRLVHLPKASDPGTQTVSRGGGGDTERVVRGVTRDGMATSAQFPSQGGITTHGHTVYEPTLFASNPALDSFMSTSFGGFGDFDVGAVAPPPAPQSGASHAPSQDTDSTTRVPSRTPAMAAHSTSDTAEGVKPRRKRRTQTTTSEPKAGFHSGDKSGQPAPSLGLDGSSVVAPPPAASAVRAVLADKMARFIEQRRADHGKL